MKELRTERAVVIVEGSGGALAEFISCLDVLVSSACVVEALDFKHHVEFRVFAVKRAMGAVRNAS